MRWAVRQLCSPVRYLMITQGEGLLSSKRTYDFVLPVVVGAIMAILSDRLTLKLGLFSEQGLVPNVISLLNLLIAFFIAALAAVATFDRKGLDDPLKGEPAILCRRNKRNVYVDHILTHRQFVCYLFGYLSFASIVFLLTLYGVRMFGDHIKVLVAQAGDFTSALNALGVFLFFALLAQLVITMLLGIYFLTDRLQFLDDSTV